MRILLAAGLFLTLNACSKKDDKGSNSAENTDLRKVTVKAGTLALGGAALKDISAQLLSGPKDPDYANGEYDGMGVSTSDAVVEAFKITLSTISFGNATTSAASFQIENGLLDITQGANSSVSVTGTLPSGKWDRVNIQFKPYYDLKAYAYMDSDNDGTIDRTVFTTVAEVKMENGRLTKAQMEEAGYAEYHYGFAYTHCSESTTNSVNGDCATISVFPEPFDIDAPIPEPTVEGEVKPETHEVNLLIDSTKVVSAWIGTSGTYFVDGTEPTTTFLGDATKIPKAVGFPESTVCSDTKNTWGYDSCDYFPYGKPAFKLNYIPAFAFLSTAGLSSQVYQVSTENGSWNHYNSGTMQFVVKNNVPQMGLVFTTPNGAVDFTQTPPKFIRGVGPLMGSVSRLFEDDGSGTYTFYQDYSMVDETGKNDGGLYYNNDKSMAGYIVTGFKLTDVGALQTIVVKDGPRCKGEYDNCAGDRTYYVKRLR